MATKTTLTFGRGGMSHHNNVVNEFNFTEDWFSSNIPLWTELFQPMTIVKKQPASLCVLEVGSFEGRSACWLIENVLKHVTDEARLVCIDTFAGSVEFDSKLRQQHSLRERFFANVIVAASRSFPSTASNRLVVEVVQQESRLALAELLTKASSPLFDLVYIDGDHRQLGVLTDLCLAWPLVKQHGLIGCDDYGNYKPIVQLENQSMPLHIVQHMAQPAIDAFATAAVDYIRRVHMGQQFWFEKVHCEQQLFSTVTLSSTTLPPPPPPPAGSMTHRNLSNCAP